MLACFHCPFICSYIAFLFFLSSTNAALIRSRLAWNLSSCTRLLIFPRCLHLQSCIVYSTPRIVFLWQKAQVVFEIKSDRWHLRAQERQRVGYVFDFCGSTRSASHGERALEMGCNTFNARGKRLQRALSSIFFRQITFGHLLKSCWSKLATFCQKKSANKKSRQKGGFNPTTMILDSILKRSYVHIGSVNWMAAPCTFQGERFIQLCAYKAFTGLRCGFQREGGSYVHIDFSGNFLAGRQIPQPRALIGFQGRALSVFGPAADPTNDKYASRVED